MDKEKYREYQREYKRKIRGSVKEVPRLPPTKNREALRLKRLIAATGLCHAELAAKIGICRYQLSRWSNGRSEPNPEKKTLLNTYFKKDIYKCDT